MDSQTCLAALTLNSHSLSGFGWMPGLCNWTGTTFEPRSSSSQVLSSGTSCQRLCQRRCKLVSHFGGKKSQRIKVAQCFHEQVKTPTSYQFCPHLKNKYLPGMRNSVHFMFDEWSRNRRCLSKEQRWMRSRKITEVVNEITENGFARTSYLIYDVNMSHI